MKTPEPLPMFTAYVVATLLAAAANTFSATVDFLRYQPVLTNMAKLGVPESWLYLLGALKAAGAIGLLAGFGVPLIGTAAAAGLILFFTAALLTHLRARDYGLAPSGTFLLLAVATLALGLAHRGPW
ncbi:MAG: DoxX family protein [Streptomyces sp.]|uniref:DoxX family protein n=1 Tax=Streptomyces sp. TaxID=1931 RepID=UPI003D6AF9EA